MKISNFTQFQNIRKVSSYYSIPTFKNCDRIGFLPCDTISFSSNKISFEQTNFEEKFSSGNLQTIDRISNFANKNNTNIYLIGGIVRDMLLGKEASDIDFLVEDDAVDFTKRLCEEFPDFKVEHLNYDFGTARINVNGEEIDIASTRTEKYEKKGIPIVSSIGCPIDVDIKRRDFTINAMALKLNHDKKGRLEFLPVDITNGLSDLNTKTLRTTYSKSFEDDPTRIIRGLKFRLKYGMHYDKKTQEMQNKLLNNPKREEFSQARINSTLRKLFEDKNLQVQGFKSILNEGIYKLFADKTNADISWAERIYPACELFEVDNIANVFVKLLDNEVTTPIIDEYDNSKAQTNYDIYQTMKNKSNEDLAVYYVVTQDENAVKFYNDLRHRKPISNGKTLISLGLKPSKEFSKILEKLFIAKLNRDDVKTQEDEIEFIKRLLNML